MHRHALWLALGKCFICESMQLFQSSLFLPSCSSLCLPLQVKLSRLCEQDKFLKDLEARISSLKDDKVHTEPIVPAHFFLISVSQLSLQAESLENWKKYQLTVP